MSSYTYHKHDFGISAEWISALCDGSGGAVKTTCSRARPPNSLNNQILDYKTILDLCENEKMLIKFFGICKESMISVENLEIEKWHEGG